MINLTPAAGRVIADDAVIMFNNTDNALLSSARLAVSVLEGTADSGMHPRTKQKLLESMNNGHCQLLESRKQFANAQMMMVAIQNRSTIQPYDWGCWGDEPTGLDKNAVPVSKVTEEKADAKADTGTA